MKKIIKWGGYVALPFIILSLVVLLKWESISYYGLRKIAQLYAGKSNISLEIGRISGSPLSETTLENVSLRPETGRPQTYNFKAQSLACTYNLWDLRDGYELFLQGLDCSANDPVFAYDLRVAAVQDQPKDEPKQFLVPPLPSRLDIHNGSFSLVDTEWDVAMRGINSSLRPGEAGQELLIETKNFQLNQDSVAKIETEFTSKLLYSKSQLTIDTLELGEEEISTTGFIDLEQAGKELIGFAADIAFKESRVNIAGSIENKFLKAQVRTDNFDIGELQKRLGGAGWDVFGNIRGQVELIYNIESKADLDGSFAFDVQDGQLNGVDFDAFIAAGNFQNGFFRISKAVAKTPDNRVTLSKVSIPMSLLSESKALVIIGESQAEFEAEIADFEALVRLFKLEDEVLSLPDMPYFLSFRGNLKNGVVYFDDVKVDAVDSSLTIGQAEIPIPATAEAFESALISLTAKFESSSLKELSGLLGDIPLNGQVAAYMSITGSIKEPQSSITFSGENLSFKDLQMGSLALQADVQLIQETLGKVNSVKLLVKELTQVNGFGTLTLLSPFAVNWQHDEFSLNADLQVDGQGNIALAINNHPEKESVVEITSQNLDSKGWLGNFVDKRYFFHGANMKAVFQGLPQNPQLQLVGTIDKAGATDVPFPLTGSFGLHYSSKGIEISEFTWKSHERNQLTLTGHLPYDPMALEPYLEGDLSLKGHIDFPALEDIGALLAPLGIGKGSLVLDMDLTGSWNQPVGHILFQVKHVEPPARLKHYMDSSMNFSGDITAQGNSIVLNSADLDSIAYSAQATGSWQHGISVKELLQKRKAELKGQVAADATVKLKDLNFLQKSLPWLRRIEGDMQGELHVAGAANDPAITGSFSLKDGEASHTFNLPMLSAINLHGDFDEHSITIKNMQAEVGGSPVNLAGKIDKGKETIAVDLLVNGKNVLLFRNNDMRMRGDVQLDVVGPLERLIIKGTAGMTGGYYTRDINFLGMIGSTSAPVSEGSNFLFSFSDPPLRDAVLDIKITTIEPFRIRNNLIRGVLRPELSVKGTGELPLLLGTVYIDPSRVVLPSGRLQIQSGLLRFLEGQPDRPQLNILAQSKVLGYDINVVTRGPLDNPVITLSSSPALPNDDLMLLLLTGQPPKQDAAGGTKSSGTPNVMVYLGRDFLNKWLEDESGTSDETILDRFELDFGRSVTKSGEQTVESTFRLSKQTAQTGKIYYMSGEKDKYDAINYGLKLVFRLE